MEEQEREIIIILHLCFFIKIDGNNQLGNLYLSVRYKFTGNDCPYKFHEVKREMRKGSIVRNL